MKKIFLVLIAAAFVASGSGLLMAQSTGQTKIPKSITKPNKPSSPKNELKSGKGNIQQDQPTPCVEKGCQLGTPQVVR